MRRINTHSRGMLAAALIAGALFMGGVAVRAAVPQYSLIDMQAPDFALHALVGGNVRLSEHRGEVIVLSFWSSRCMLCGPELAALDRSFKTYQSAGLQVFGISVDDNAQRAREFAQDNAVGFTMLADLTQQVSRIYQVDYLPMVVLIDRNGTLRHVHHEFGPTGEALYLQQLRTLLNE